MFCRDELKSTDHRPHVYSSFEAKMPGRHFKVLKEMAQKHGLKNLSMGMTKDYDLAIAEGATHIRVGTAIFGARDYS